MHRCLQFDMRENPASDRRHGSRSVSQKDLFPDTSPHSLRQQTMLAASDDSEVKSATAKGFATGEGREAAGAARTLASSTRAAGDTQISADANHNTNRQPQRIVNDSEFEPLLDVAEAARLLRIHPKTLRVKAGHGIIPGIQIGRVWRFRASTLNRWLEGIAGYGRR
jgi:excisionase family DNA binding protein